MQGVMQEKNNRIVEVRGSSVKPFQLMMGKIIGIAFVGLTQFIIWMAMIFGGIMMFGLFFGASSMGDISASGIDQQIMMNQEAMSQLSNTSGMMGDITEIIAGINLTRLIVGFLIYFIGGYLLYAALLAAICSVVARDADPQ